MYERYHNKDGERIKIRFGPQGADFLSLDFLMKVKRLAREKKHSCIFIWLRATGRRIR